MVGTFTNNEEENFQSFEKGEEKGFSIFFNQWYTPIFYFADSLLNDIHSSEDVAINSFTKLWENRHEFTSPKSCKAYLYSITRNECIDLLRRKRMAKSKERELATTIFDHKNLIDEIIVAETAREIQDALDTLPGQCRKIFQLAFREGRTNPEVAAKLQLSVNTVRAQKQRGLTLLRKKLSFLKFLFILFSI
jgi:RNA polymerase sigma-70 factor (family 1)